MCLYVLLLFWDISIIFFFFPFILTHGWKCEEGYSEHAETRCHDFSHPGLWDSITITDRGYSDLEKKKKNRFLKEIFLHLSIYLFICLSICQCSE